MPLSPLDSASSAREETGETVHIERLNNLVSEAITVRLKSGQRTRERFL
jgi:hypothetical protein